MTTIGGVVKISGSGLGLAIRSRATSAMFVGATRPRRARYASITGDGASEKFLVANQVAKYLWVGTIFACR